MSVDARPGAPSSTAFPSEWEIDRATTWRDKSRTTTRPKIPFLAIVLLSSAVAVGLAASIEPLVGMLALALVPIGAVVSWRPGVVTVGVLGLLYINLPAVLQAHGGGPVAAALVPIALLIPLVHRLVVRRDSLRLTYIFPFVMLYGLAMLTSALAADDLTAALGEVSGFAFEGLALFVLVTSTVTTTRMLRRVLWAIVLAGAFLGLLSGIQQVTGTYDNDYLGFAKVSNSVIETSADAGGVAFTNTHGNVGLPRLAGPVGEKNRYAQILVVLVPLALALMKDAGRRQRWLLVACIGLHVTGMALTYSRGVVVGIVAAFLLAVFMRMISVKALGVVVLIGAVALAASPTYLDRVVSLAKVVSGGQAQGTESADNSIRGRATENLAAALAFKENFVTGVGPGAFPAKYVYYAQRVGGRPRLEDREAHNLYLGIASELGFPGIAAFLAVLAVTLAGLRRTRRLGLDVPPDATDRASNEARRRGVLASGLIISLSTYMVTGIFLHLSYQRYFWLLVALCAVAALPPDRWRRAIAASERKRLAAVPKATVVELPQDDAAPAGLATGGAPARTPRGSLARRDKALEPREQAPGLRPRSPA